MITKKLLHDIITFCNNYIDNKNIIISVVKYPTFINATIDVWTINNNIIQNHTGGIYYHIDDINGFERFKQKVLNELPLLLKQVKEN